MKIGNFNFKSGKTFIIAELSANHNGSLEVAKQTIKAARKAGADAIKLQTYTADTLTLDCKNREFMLSGGTLWDGKSLYELYRQAYTPWEWHKELFSCAKNEGLECFSSPFDKSAVDFLEQFNPPAYKIASFEITDYELIRYVAKKQKPIIISTGVAKKSEIKDVLKICKKEGNKDIILLKCTSAYPAPLEYANLKTIKDMQKRFNIHVGFSDHTLGSLAPAVAVSLGACVIEKHFILDKSIGGADAGFSLDFDEFSAMVKAVRDTEKLLGNVNYKVSKSSRKYARSLYACKSIKKGETITKKNIKSIRPSNGLHPKYLDKILGKKATCDIEFATPFKKKYVKSCCEK